MPNNRTPEQRVTDLEQFIQLQEATRQQNERNRIEAETERQSRFLTDGINITGSDGNLYTIYVSVDQSGTPTVSVRLAD